MTTDSTCQPLVMSDDHHRRLTGRALNVDHITPHRGDERIFLDVRNMQLLCHVDHNRKSQREQA